MGIFDEDKKKDSQAFGLFNFINDENDNEEEYDNDELNDLQKEEIKKGNQDPWDFEENDKDDDNYYSEDDDEDDI